MNSKSLSINQFSLELLKVETDFAACPTTEQPGDSEAMMWRLNTREQLENGQDLTKARQQNGQSQADSSVQEDASKWQGNRIARFRLMVVGRHKETEQLRVSRSATK